MKIFGFILVCVIVALGAIGVGHAAWAQSLTVNGTVNSGIFNVQIVMGTVTPGTNTPASYATVTPSGGVNAPLTLTFALAVPGTYTIPLTVTNNSTIPVAISYPGISTGTLPTGSTVTGGPAKTSFAAGANDGGTTLTVTIPNSMVTTGGSYSFSVPITVTQGS
jgi:hypothetical protein